MNNNEKSTAQTIETNKSDFMEEKSHAKWVMRSNLLKMSWLLSTDKTFTVLFFHYFHVEKNDSQKEQRQ